jgi:hypothetical protein
MPQHMWVALRIAFIAAWAVAGFLAVGGKADLPLAYWLPPAACAGAVLIMRLWVKPMFARVVPEASWASPNWRSNPFSLREPLQAFHLFAMSFFAFSIASFAKLAVNNAPFHSFLSAPALMATAWALGTLLGIRWVQEASPDLSAGKPNNSLERTRDR